MSSGQTSLEQMLGVYKWVVDDVIKNVRDDFLNEGADTQVLEDLKQLWENKLVQSGALSRPVKETTKEPPTEKQHSGKSTTSSAPPPPPLPLPVATNNDTNDDDDDDITITTVTTTAPVGSSVIQQAPPRSTTPTASSNLILPPPSLLSSSPTQSTMTTTNTTNTSSPVIIASPPQVSTPSVPALQVLGQSGQPLIGMTAAAALAQQAALYQSLTSAMSTGATPAAAVVGGNQLQPLVIPGGSLSMGGLSPGLSLIQHGGIPYAAVPTATGVTYVPIALNLPTAAIQETPQNIPQSDGPLPTLTEPLLPRPLTTSTRPLTTSTRPLTTSIEPTSTQPLDTSTRPITPSTGPLTTSTELCTGPLTTSTGPTTASTEPLTTPVTTSPSLTNSNIKSATSMMCKRKPPRGTIIIQLDGPPPPPDGSSSEESEDSSESEAEDFDDEPINDEEPLNSDDDAESDEEDDNVWETDNTIVCQFEKVYRVRSKWKFALKDGIMHLKGHDYIFTKTTGEAEW